MIHNIELKPGHGGQYARSAGTFGVLIQKVENSKFAQIRLKSKEQRLVPLDCIATIGVVSNPDHGSISLSKAGRSRWLRRRPTVRGVAMNPVDHPHGGGEGKTSGGRPSVSPWGKLTKGPKTRSPRKNSDLILQNENVNLNMSRSIWKGPFVQTSLRKKVNRAKDYIADPTKKGRVRIKTTSRGSTILEDFIGLTFLVHNGKRYQQVVVNSQMVGRKFGEFAFTRQRYFFKKGKK